MHFGVLGRLEVHRGDEEVDLGAFRQRALLGLLLTSPNTVWSTDRILDELWGPDSLGDKQTLWVYISGLRKALEPDRPKRTDGSVILTRSPGYLVSVEADELDSTRFERLVVEGRALLDTDPAAASMVIGEALALWRGSAFEDFTYEPFAQTEIARLTELRIEAVTARIEADLACGRAHELVSELGALVRQHPLREELTGHWMLALYRSGRQAEALRAFQMLRARLVEELGIEPSLRLRELNDQMVVGDQELQGTRGTRAVDGVSPGLTVRGYELRGKIGEDGFGAVYRAYQPMVGREVAIKVIRPEYANDPTFIRQFDAEARLVAGLEHPHVVPLYDFWREPDAAYLVTRLLRGGTLADVIASGAVAAGQVADVAAQVGGALQAAHRSGVVHRDIRPSNILMDDDGNAYLSDFGIAVVDGEGAADVGDGRASDVYDLAVVVARALTGLDGDIRQMVEALPGPTMQVIDNVTENVTDERGDPRHENVEAFVADLQRSLATDVITDDISDTADLVNPYKGLRAFNGGDAADFFGRDRLVERLISQLGLVGAIGRFVAVVGPSGSGKSSVVKAGLLPALRRGALPRSSRWFVVEMAPAPHPFEALEEALRSVAVEPPASLLEVLVSDKTGLERTLEHVPCDDGSQVLLVIDQFEELFTQVAPAVTKRFLDTLVHAVTAEHSTLRVVVTLRADFYDRPLSHGGLSQLLRNGTQVVTPMTPAHLEQAITGPLDGSGVRFQPALVAELLRDVSDRPGALPLLQYTLTELFDRRTGHVITTADYQELGGVSGALVKRADGLLAGMRPEAKDSARQVFLRLLTLGEEGEDTRRRVMRSELEQLGLDGTDLRTVLETFGRHRMLSFDRDPLTRGPTVEISHEALLSAWTRLRDWIADARDDVRNQRRLAGSMAEWRGAEEDDQYLLRGGRLEQLHGWSGSTSVTLSAAEREFLHRSLAERDRAENERAATEERALHAERQAKRRVRQLVGTGVIGLLVAALALFGIVQWRGASTARDQAAGARDQAELARDDAEAAREANDSLVIAEGFRTASDTELTLDAELALLYAVEAVRATADLGFATEGAVDSLHWALQQFGVQYSAGADADITIRSGPTGLTGVFVLPPSELVALAEGSTDRRLTAQECAAVVSSGQCPEAQPVPADLPLRFGLENYVVTIPQVLPGVPTFGTGSLAGTRVTVAAAANTGRNEGLRAELNRFTEVSGIEVDVIDNRDFDLTRLLATGEVTAIPDVVGFWSPPPPWAESRTMDVGAYLNVDRLRSDFGDHLVDSVMSSGSPGERRLTSVIANTRPDGLVLYPKRTFDEAGYDVPQTWDELLQLSDRMVEDGHTPWCVQWESGFASGFAGADFLESLLIRVGGPGAMDALATGEAAFDSAAVVEAARLGQRLLFTPNFVNGGPESASRLPWDLAALEMLDVNPLNDQAGPNCLLTHAPGQMLDILGPPDNPNSGRLGVDIDYFMLPPLDASTPAPVVAGTILYTPLADRPEVRALMNYVASPYWGEVWARDQTGIGDPFVSSNRRFNTFAYGVDRAEADADVRVRLYEQNRAAIEAGVWRMGASDRMPLTFATWTNEYVPGPYWQGMIDWVDQAAPIEEILADIQTARESLAAE